MSLFYFLVNLIFPYGFLTIIIFSFLALFYFFVSEYLRIKKVKTKKRKREKPREEVLKRWHRIRKIRKQRKQQENQNKRAG